MAPVDERSEPPGDYGTMRDDGALAKATGSAEGGRLAPALPGLSSAPSPDDLTKRLARVFSSRGQIESDPNKRILVDFAQNDSDNPFNYSLSRKMLIFGVMGLNMFWVTGISTLYAAVVQPIADEFEVSNLVARIPLAMYLLGFSIGPVFLTPISEDYGRKIVYTVSMALLYLMQIPCALAPNIGTLIVCRLLGGIFASPIFNSLCCIPDMWQSRDPLSQWTINGWALIAESIVLSPLIGAWINHHLGWRWVFWIALIVGFGLEAIYVLVVPETRGGPILSRRARRLRRKTGNDAYYAEHELIGRRSIKEILVETVIRPVRMLFTEPIVWAFAIWDGFNYGIIYLVVDSVVLIYAQYGFNDVQSYLVFFSFIVGYFIAIATVPLAQRAERRLEEERGGECPEAKLWWSKWGGMLFPISLYWIAATSRPDTPWIVSAIAFGAFAISSHIIFVVVSDYTVAAYGAYASSAVTGQSFAREIASASLALVGEEFYQNLGGPRYFWPTMILAFIATPMAAIPFVFDRFGPEIRRRSPFAQSLKYEMKVSTGEDSLLLKTTPASSRDPSPYRRPPEEEEADLRARRPSGLSYEH